MHRNPTHDSELHFYNDGMVLSGRHNQEISAALRQWCPEGYSPVLHAGHPRYIHLWNLLHIGHHCLLSKVTPTLYTPHEVDLCVFLYVGPIGIHQQVFHSKILGWTYYWCFWKSWRTCTLNLSDHWLRVWCRCLVNGWIEKLLKLFNVVWKLRSGHILGW